MSDAEEFQGPEAPYTITLKGGAGFESPWLVVRAASAEDAIALLAEATLNELPEKIAEFAGDFRAKNSQNAGAGAQSAAREPVRGTARRATGSPSRSGGSQRRASAPAPSGDVEYHPEGIECDECQAPVQYKEIAKGNKVHKFWTCPNQRQRNDGHFSEYIND